jgi:hypothetical protein
VRTNFPEPEQLAAILAALPEYLRGVVVLADLTAWRIRSMVLTLRWEHVDWKTQMIRLPATLSQNKEAVVFPFGPLPDLKQLLEHQLAGAEPVSAEHVFYQPNGRAIDYKVMRTKWKAACRKAKRAGMWMHWTYALSVGVMPSQKVGDERRQQQIVRNRGDLLGFAPGRLKFLELAFEGPPLRFLMGGHLERQANFVRQVSNE